MITVISEEKSSCSYHLKIIFQEFSALIIFQLWQFSWDRMTTRTVSTVGYQTYNLERNKNAPDISSDTDVLLMFNLELNKVSWISACRSCSYILLTLNYCCHSSFSRKYEPVNGFTLFPFMIETEKDWKHIYLPISDEILKKIATTNVFIN